MFVNIVLMFYFLVLINDSIAQQQGTGTADEFLASHREQAITHGA
jgi:hypothetical protein